MFKKKWFVIYGSEKIKNPIASDYSQVHWMDCCGFNWDDFAIGKAKWFHSFSIKK